MKTNKWVSAALATTLAVSGLVGCASKEETKTGDGGKSAAESAKPAEPTTIKALAILSSGEPPVLENNQALKEIEKRANVKLQVEFVPGDVYTDKVNIAIAAGSQYDMILMTDGKDDKFVKLVKQGAFHDISALVKESKDLQRIPQYTWDNTTVDGKVFGVPRPRAIHGGGNANFFIRKDWLDKYGLAVPKTIDEFTNALKVFKEKDPAGGGKTIPLVAGPFTSSWYGSLNPIGFGFGLPYTYKVDGDKASAYFQQPEYKAYLDWIKMAYTGGLIDKDAPVLKSGQVQDKFLSGVAGAWVNNVGLLNENKLATIRKADSKAEVVGIPSLTGPEGKTGVQMIEGYFGIWVIPSNVSKEKAKKIVEFLSWSASDEATVLGKAGVEGVHYASFNKELNVAERTDEQKKLYDKEKPNLLILQNDYTKYYYVDSQKPEIQQAQKDVLDAFDKIGFANPFLMYLSETNGKNPDNTKKITDATVNYVMGKGEWSAVQAEIDAWGQGIGATILKEYMDQYNANKK